MKKAIYLFLVACALSTNGQNLSSSLTACYALNGNGTEPINNFTGTLNAVSPSPDRFNNAGSALAFSGSSLSYIELPGNALLKPTNAFTFAGWIKTSVYGDQYILMTRCPNANNFEAYCLHLGINGGQLRLRAKKGNGSGGTILATSSSGVSLNTWYHVAMTVDNSSLNIYIDGVLEASSTITFPFNYLANKNVILGGSNETSYNLPFSGAMDNLKFYNRVLTPLEITSLYNSDPVCQPIPTSTLTACYAFDGNANEPINNLNGVLSSVTPTVDRFNNASSAYHFTGAASSYIQLPNSPLLKPTTAISCNMWLRFDDMASNHYILYTSNGCSNYFEGYAMTLENVAGGYKFIIAKSNSNCSSSGQFILTGTTNISALTWYNVGLYIGTDSMKIYVNGAVDAAVPTSASPLAYNSGNVYFGSTLATWNYPMRATLDNVKFYSGKLSNQEVSQLYTTDPPCSNPPAHAINFDGIDDFVSPNTFLSAPANNFTYEMWARPTATHEIDLETNSGTNQDGALNQKFILWPTHRLTDGGIGISAGTNGVSVYQHGNAFIESLLTWTGTLTGWTHIAVVVNNKQPSLYINGALVKTGLTSSKNNVWPSLGGGGSFPAQIGGIGGGFYGYYAGDVDEFRLWNSVRTQTQIAANRFSEFNCPPPGLIAYYRFNHGIASANNSSVTTATDYSGNNYTATLTALALNGNTSNWVNPGAPLTTTLSPITVSASASSTLFCLGQTLTLTATGASSYTWQPGNLSGNTVTVSPTANTIYTVTGSNGACTGSTNVLVLVFANPTVSVIAQQTLVCQGYAIGINGLGAQSYTWQPGNLTGANIIPTLSANSVFTVTGTSSLGCIDTETVLISVSNCTIPPLNCNSSFYSQGTAAHADRIIITDLASPGTSTVSSVVLPYGALGLAIGPAFGFPAPNPTFWTTRAGTYWYHNGSAFINTGHITTAWNLAGSANYLYGLASSGTISRYNGSTSTSLGFMIPPVIDLAADDQDNFYLLSYTHLSAFNSAGTLICTAIPHTGLSGSNGNYAGGLAIVNHSVITSNGVFGNLNIGTMGGTSISFTPTAYNGGTYDFASCPFVTAFTSTISASSPSISCSSPTIVLSALTPPTVIGSSFTYTWAGPGIIGSQNVANIAVNVPGVYTSLIRSCNGGTSSATFTVGNNVSNPIITASVSPASICAGSIATLTASNASSYTWQPGNLSGNTVTVSPALTTTYTVMGSNGSCTSSANVVVSVLTALTLSPTVSHSATCPGYSVSLNTNQSSLNSIWQPGNLSGNTVTVTAIATTIYTVTATNGGGCSNTSTLLLTVNNCTLPAPGCGTHYYGMLATGTDLYAITSTGTLTYSSVLPPGSTGVAVGPAFGFTAPNPTYWAVSGGTYWYHNGASFINTGHLTGHNLAQSPGGSANYLYNITPAGAVYRYNGTGNGTFLVNAFSLNSFISDIVGDDLDNFYIQTCCGSGSLTIYDKTGVLKCGFGNTPGVVSSSSSQGALAIIGNTVNVCGQLNQLQTGVVSGNTLGLVTFTNPIAGYDFASCMLNTPFSSSITASNGGTITCSTNGVSLFANSMGTGFNAASSYTWTGPVTIQSPNTQSIQATTAGVYSCYIQSCRGGTSVATYTVYISTVIPVSISSSSVVLCQGGTSTLTASGAMVYSWTPSPSINFTTGAMASVSPTITTTYSVMGLSGICAGNTVITVSVVPNSSLILSSSNPSICEGNSITLNSSAGFTGILWQPGNSTSQSYSVSPAVTSIYTASAIYGVGSGTCISTNTISVVVNPKPILNLSSSSNSICMGQSAVLSASGAANYTWSPGLSTSPTLTVSPSLSTTYLLSGTSIAGCINHATILVSVNPTPTVFVSPIGITGSWTICEGSGLLIGVQGANNYTFTPAASINTTAAFPNGYIASPLVTTIYTVNGEVGTCTDDVSFTVTVNAAPVISISNASANICKGESIQLSASGGLNYMWEPGAVNTQSLLVSPVINTSYTVTALGNSGCTATSVANVSVTQTPTLNLSANSQSICSGSSTTFSVNGAASYTWLPSGQTGSNVILSPLADALYTVVGANANCLSQIHFSVLVIDCNVPKQFGLTNAASNPVPYNSNYYKINFTVITKNASAEILKNVILNSDLKNAFPYPCTYTVITAPKLVSKNSQLSANILFDGDLQVSLTNPSTSTLLAGAQDTLQYGILVEPKGFYGPVKNSVVGFATLPNNIMMSDSSNNGFTWDPDQDGDPTNNNEVTIIDLKEIKLFIPEGFSPNDDGKNDLFVINGLNNRHVKINIFNRWGNKVFTQEGKEIAWDGRANLNSLNLGSDRLPPATYFYVLEFQDGDKQSVNGFVVLQY